MSSDPHEKASRPSRGHRLRILGWQQRLRMIGDSGGPLDLPCQVGSVIINFRFSHFERTLPALAAGLATRRNCGDEVRHKLTGCPLL